MKLTEKQLESITREEAMDLAVQAVYEATEFMNQLQDKGLIKGYADAFRCGMANYVAHGIQIRWKN